MRDTLHTLVFVAAAAAAFPALGQGCYELTAPSAYQEGCTTCDCPDSTPFPMSGMFRLSVQSFSQFQEVYDITDVSFQVAAAPPADPPITTFTGSGTYTRNRPFRGDRTHTLELSLSADGAPPQTYVTAVAAPDPLEFPTINIQISDAVSPCMHVLTVQAKPACSCEMTCDAAIDVFDLLAYLDLWFAMDIAAELDGQPDITVFDLLSYLDCWFEGCA